MTASSTAAVRHLKKLKPLDGWMIETKPNHGGCRLHRRNVPLTDNYFLDIFHDAAGSGAVVGILTKPRTGSTKAYAQVLVDATGTLVRKRQTLSVEGWEPNGAASRATPNPSSDAVPVLSDEQNLQLLKFGAMGIGGILLLRALLNAAMVLYVLALPIVYLYMVQQCPSDESFDAKRELKRVMRGHHLPEDHPDKPKGFFSETLARVAATVTAEVATGLGYELTLLSMAGAAKVASVRVPAAKMEYYWLGIIGKWYFVYSHEIQDATE